MTAPRHLKIILSLVAIFLVGGGTGSIITYNVAQRSAANRFARDSWIRDQFKELAARLNLNAEQRARIQPIFERKEAELKKIRSQCGDQTIAAMRKMDEELARELTADQQKMLGQIRDEQRARYQRYKRDHDSKQRNKPDSSHTNQADLPSNVSISLDETNKISVPIEAPKN